MDALRAWLARNPRWLGAVLLFCLYMTFVYGPFDTLIKPLYSPVSEAEEVWLGVVLRGWAAKATEPLHWALYAALAFGLWRERAWAAVLGSVYAFQVAGAMLVWSVRAEETGPWGLLLGWVAFGMFAWLGVALWGVRRRFA